MVEKQHLDVHDVAKYFGIRASTVYRLAQAGKLPGFKVGGQWRFNRKMLESWVARQVSGARRTTKPGTARARKRPHRRA